MPATETVRVREDRTCKIGTGRITGYDIYRPTGEKYDRPSGPHVYPKVAGTQKTVSTGHPFRSRDKRDLSDIGGPFFTTRSWLEAVNSSGKCVYGPTNSGDYRRFREYTGPILPFSPSNLLFPDSIHSSGDEMDQMGATAIARCKPTNSVADVSVAIGELFSDGLPHLIGSSTWKDRTNRARGASDDFLNVQFGWLPLIGDVQKFSHAVSKSDVILAQYEKDAGKVVRRRYSFPIERTSTSSVIGTGIRSWIDPSVDELFFWGGIAGDLSLKVETFRSVSFSGAFTYALPSGSDSRSKMARYALEAKKIYGLSLTPETLWNLAPWSWAVDWFSNTGDVISNISDWATDGLVMRYGYLMEHTRVRHTYTLSKHGRLDQCSEVSPLTYVTETKQRTKANPFGFGFSWSGLSPLQLAITAALGISRS